MGGIAIVEPTRLDRLCIPNVSPDGCVRGGYGATLVDFSKRHVVEVANQWEFIVKERSGTEETLDCYHDRLPCDMRQILVRLHCFAPEYRSEPDSHLIHIVC